MSSISIDKPLAPGQKANFTIDMTFYGYSKTMEFTIEVPNAAPLLSRVDNIVLENKAGPPKEKTKGNYGFSRYEVKSNISNTTFYRLLIKLNNSKIANQLQPGDKINFISSDPKLAALNNKNYEIIKDSNSNPRYVMLKVDRSDRPTQNLANASGSLQEITGTIKTRRYTITIPNKVFNGLISERIPGKAAKEGMVEDITIYAFKRFKDTNKASIKRKLMTTGSEINEKTPPDRSDVLDFRGKKSYSRLFDLDEENKFIFYVAIARYIYDGEKWTKQWVQTDSSDRVIWGKAVEKKGK